MFLRILSDYFLRVAPLSQEETFILQKLVETYPSSLVAEAIATLSADSNRSFSHFLKALDSLTDKATPREGGDMRSLKFSIKQRLKAIANP